jgi:soluble lytic murein transglycosylase-like protein
MPFIVRLLLLAATGAALAVSPGQAQLDLRPPGLTAPARPAAPAVRRPTEQAPRPLSAAPLPPPRPPEADDGGAGGEPQLATVPAPEAPAPPAAAPVAPAVAPAPAAPAMPPAAADANPFDAAFSAAGAARAPALAPTRPPPPYALPPERPVDGRPFSERTFPVGRSAHLPTVRELAAARRVPIDLADAIITIESGYDPHAVGMADEIGLMQIRLSTARDLGFTGTAQDLFDPQTNIRLGIAYLAGAWERAGGNLCEALARYRNGWDDPRMSPLTMEYCRRAVIHLAAIGSQLARGRGPSGPAETAAAPSPADPEPSAGAPNGARNGASAPDRRFDWTEHESRIRQIEQRFGGDNFGIIAR